MLITVEVREAYILLLSLSKKKIFAYVFLCSFYLFLNILSSVSGLSMNIAMASGSSAFPDWLKASLECPVCLDTFRDPPIYTCENLRGLGQKYHRAQKDMGNQCPICRGGLTWNRNHTVVENILDRV